MGHGLTRRDGWEAALREAVEVAREKPFAWGANDCALFAADCALVITGTDLAASFRGKYATAAGARRALMRLGKGALVETVTAALGGPIAPALARRGDVVLFRSIPPDAPPGGIEALAVCLGEVAASPGPRGMTYVPMSEWLNAWRV